MVICLELDADLHMAQLMPLPLTVSRFSKIQIGFTFLVPAHLGSPGQRAVKCVCVCVCVCMCVLLRELNLEILSRLSLVISVHRILALQNYNFVVRCKHTSLNTS